MCKGTPFSAGTPTPPIRTMEFKYSGDQNLNMGRFITGSLESGDLFPRFSEKQKLPGQFYLIHAGPTVWISWLASRGVDLEGRRMRFYVTVLWERKNLNFRRPSWNASHFFPENAPKKKYSKKRPGPRGTRKKQTNGPIEESKCRGQECH